MNDLLQGFSGRASRPVRAPASFLFLRSGFHLSSRSFELGLGGVCLDLGEDVPEFGDRVMVSLEGVRRPVSVWAEVCWQQDGRCGMRFTGLAHQDMVEILELGLDAGARCLFPWESPQNL